MKPISRKVKHSTPLLQDIGTGPVIAKITGTVKKMGNDYKDAVLILYNKANLKPIIAIRPNENGDYQIFGLNTSLKTFIVAIDQKQQYNAVIQDNVEPK